MEKHDMKRLIKKLKAWLLKDAGSHAQRCQNKQPWFKCSGRHEFPPAKRRLR